MSSLLALLRRAFADPASLPLSCLWPDAPQSYLSASSSCLPQPEGRSEASLARPKEAWAPTRSLAEPTLEAAATESDAVPRPRFLDGAGVFGACGIARRPRNRTSSPKAKGVSTRDSGRSSSSGRSSKRRQTASWAYSRQLVSPCENVFAKLARHDACAKLNSQSSPGSLDARRSVHLLTNSTHQGLCLSVSGPHDGYTSRT